MLSAQSTTEGKNTFPATDSIPVMPSGRVVKLQKCPTFRCTNEGERASELVLMTGGHVEWRLERGGEGWHSLRAEVLDFAIFALSRVTQCYLTAFMWKKMPKYKVLIFMVRSRCMDRGNLFCSPPIVAPPCRFYRGRNSRPGPGPYLCSARPPAAQRSGFFTCL